MRLRKLLPPTPLLKNGLTHDLRENQAICGTCQGTGLAVSDSMFGLGESNKEMFPYHNQYIVGCCDCYFGVVSACRHCGKSLKRSTFCGCDGVKAELANEKRARESESFAKAIKIEADSPEAQEIGVFYSESYSSNEGYFSDIEAFMEAWNDENELGSLRPEYVWGTAKTSISIDAEDVVEAACSDLHEEAAEDLDVKGLQGVLDKWCAEQAGTVTYQQDTTYAVRVPWEAAND